MAVPHEFFDLTGRVVCPMGPTRFGTGSERDLVHDRLHHYFQIVDRELAGFFKGALLQLIHSKPGNGFCQA